jgi:pimeloyl-ACP methyl ester carboxylesterase
MERALWDRYGLEPTERFVELSSPAVRLRIVEVGSGPPVLFVHGTAGTGPVWAPLVRELSGFRCLLLDRPGWAFSSPLDYSRDDYGALVAEILSGTLAALGIDRGPVVGASIGDLWALRLAQRDPGRVDRVVLLGGGPLVSGVEVPPFIRLLASPVGALLVRRPMKAGRVRAIMRDSGHGASLDAGRIPDEFIDWRVSLARETDSMRHERDMVRAVVSGKGFRPGFVFADAEVGAVPQPTLLVYGTSDPVGSVDLWRRVVGLLPRGELHLVENGGHLPWLDEPAGVATRVGRFLAAA